MKDREWIVGTDPDELYLLRLGRFKSFELSKRLLKEKEEKKGLALENELLNRKAQGLSSAIDSALNYFSVKSNSLNTKILMRYYSLLQFTIAEEVASLNNDSDLNKIQNNTSYGHGLAVYQSEGIDDNFFNKFNCYILSNGHFSKYLKHLNYTNISNISINKRVSSEKEAINEASKLISISRLFRTIPELHNMVEEIIDEPPLSLNIIYDSIPNYEIEEERREEYSKEIGTFAFKAPPLTSEEKISFLKILPNSRKLNIEFLNSLNLPFTNYKLRYDSYSGEEYISCQIEHSTKSHWWSDLNLYKSNYCASSIIPPIIGEIADPILINFMLLYSLSIIVRYLPALWYKITLGDLNHIGGLIEYYISVLDHVLPPLILKRITERDIHISMPGSLDAPI